MAQPDDVVAVVLDRYGRTFSAEVGFDPTTDKPAPLFKLLVLSLLLSARIRADVAVAAARALLDAGWTTPEKLAGSTWRQRTDVLNHAGYARYDESTSRMLADTTDLLLDRYRGDLRRLREAADRDVATERRLLTDFSGIGPMGADIFLREVQPAWDEVFPFADDKVLACADRLGLPANPETLADLAGSPADAVRLVAGLVRVDLARAHDEVLAAADAAG